MSVDDAKALAGAYAPDVAVGEDVLRHLVELAHGSVRRVVVNLVNLADAAKKAGTDSVDMAKIKELPFELYRGESPKRGLSK